jgi:hypothetical protein
LPSRLLVLAAVVAAVAGIAADRAPASGRMQLGIYDDAQVLGRPDESFPLFEQLRVQVIRVTLHWGGRLGVAPDARPQNATDPDDPAYDWFVYDRAVKDATDAGIKVVFSIVDTPRWANGGKGLNRAPTKPSDLRNFAYAAARRYSGSYIPDDGDPTTEDEKLPPVRYWLAWNEPNNPLFLWPQWLRVGKGKKRHWVAQSPIDYAKICSAVFTGVHLTTLAGEKVGCGVTGPRGNNRPTGTRPSIGPIPFLRALKRAGLKRFDVYAHHPYYGKPTETPTSQPTSNRGKRGLIAPPILLGNISELIKEVTRLYGPKRLWITEYGYQTRPPDRAFGVTWAKQAAYLRQAVRIARRNPKIDMMLWFLLRDETRLGGWQSGLFTATMVRKPAFAAFRAARG